MWPRRSTAGQSGPLSNRGVKLHGAGFIVNADEAAALGLGRLPGLERHIRDYRNGRDLTQTPRGVMVIDLFGLTAEEVRARYPEVYQWVLERVKPERDQNKRQSRKDNWWLFGETNPKLRRQLAGLPRYIATVETAKHRTFVFLDQSILPDNKLIAIALDDAWTLGVLSSRVHVFWALATGSRLGVGNDPVYVKTRCFETFPFPAPGAPEKDRIRQLAEDLDAHRKARQALHPGLTMTGMYNVLEQLRRGEPLSAKEKTIHEQGLVSVLRQLHDELDAAVLAAYGWEDLTAALLGSAGRGMRPVPNVMSLTPTRGTRGPTRHPKRCGRGKCPVRPADRLTSHGEGVAAGVEEAILHRLVALNAERAAEERRGLVRWLRPEFQNPAGAGTVEAETGTGRRRAGRRRPQTGLAQDHCRTNSRPCAPTWPPAPDPRAPPTWRSASPAPRAPRSPSCSTPSPVSAMPANWTTAASSPASTPGGAAPSQRPRSRRILTLRRRSPSRRPTGPGCGAVRRV